jgi:DNA polymerase II small subunit/DNA polymerase delta subunit B
MFEREGISNVYVAGDLLAGGKMYRGQEFELWAHGADAQIDLAVNSWPEKKDMTTHFITGNHDLSFYKTAGVDVGHRLQELRSDFNYLGREEADIVFNTEQGTARMRLVHPGKGTAYALSYQPQKYIEALEGGKKPHVICMGHYHKAEKLPQYRNIYLIQTGCIEAQTPFMRRNNISAHCGFWIIKFMINEAKMVSRFKSEFVSWFAKQV